MPRGTDYRIPLLDLFQAAEQHRVGWSLRAIARMRWEQWGYASPDSALEGLRRALRSIDAPVRDRIEATVGRIEVPIRAEWDGDGMVAHVEPEVSQ